MKTKTLRSKRSMNSASCQFALLILLALVCFALLPQARAACQEGCLAGDNTVLGEDALFSLTTGTLNTAVGFNALYALKTGPQNTGLGYEALSSITDSIGNTAVGFRALRLSTTGSWNTAVGDYAMSAATTGSQNTAVGTSALEGDTSGSDNTAIGSSALRATSTGIANTATGSAALDVNTTGSFNTAYGHWALLNSTTASYNVAVGDASLENDVFGNSNVAVGYRALINATGSNNIGLGDQAGFNLTSGSNNIAIGSQAVSAESGVIRIGTAGTQVATFIAGIRGAAITGAMPVGVNANGQLGVRASSGVFKEDIQAMDKDSEAILSLRPVSFRYKQRVEPHGAKEFGLIAEEVEKVSPDLVARDEQGKPYTVRYDAVNAMLPNEFLKEHRTVQEQGATIARLEKQVEALTAAVQNVSAQLEVAKPTSRTVSR